MWFGAKARPVMLKVMALVTLSVVAAALVSGLVGKYFVDLDGGGWNLLLFFLPGGLTFYVLYGLAHDHFVKKYKIETDAMKVLEARVADKSWDLGLWLWLFLGFALTSAIIVPLISLFELPRQTYYAVFLFIVLFIYGASPLKEYLKR